MRFGLGINFGASPPVASSSQPIEGLQVANLQIVAAAFAPIIGSQTITLVIVATHSALLAAQFRMQVAAATTTLGTTMRAAGSTPVVLLAAGTGSLTFAGGAVPGFKVTILGGALTFDLSFDSGNSTAFAGQTIPVGGGNYTIPSGTYSGMIITFPLGTYTAAGTYEGTVATALSTEGNSYNFSQATASIQPVFRHRASTPAGQYGWLFAGAQYLSSTAAGVLTLLTDDPAHTVRFRVAYTVAAANGAVYSVAQTGGSNGKRRYGQISSGSGRQNYSAANNAGSAISGITAAAATALTSAHNVAWSGPGSNGAENCSVNGGAADPTATANYGTLTPGRAAIGAVADNAADTFVSALFYDLAIHNTQLGGSDSTAWETAMTNGTPS